MRAPFLLIPITLALASMSAGAQYAPRVIFCAGQCFAVDDKGVRTPAPKGTELRPGQRLETGPGAYAQLKLGPDTALGVGEQARLRFDRDRVGLDQGRIRALGRLDVDTPDGPLALRSAGTDVELKTPASRDRTASSVTVVKLNAGDARFGDIPISKESALGFAAGKLSDKLVSVADVALPPSRGAVAPGALVPAPVTELPRTTLPSLPGALPIDRTGPIFRPLPATPLPIVVVDVPKKVSGTPVKLPDGTITRLTGR
jgi:hypothetical protein